MGIDEVVRRVEAAPARLGRVKLVALDGPSGAGKTTTARALVAALGAERTALVPTDHFATWDEPVSWWPWLRAGVLDPLAAGREARYRRVQWSDGLPGEGPLVCFDTPEILLLEGVSSGRRSASRLLSVLVWLRSGDRATRLARAVDRDGEACREPLERWQEFESGWFAADGTRSRAACVLDGTPPGVAAR